MRRIAVVGAAAVGDYIFRLNRLPEKGEIVRLDPGEPDKLIPGGCAPNIAAGLQSLGKIQPVLYYPVGRDLEALGIQAVWDEAGFRRHLTVVEDTPSGRAWMYMQPDGTTMCFSMLGAAGAAVPAPEEIQEEWVVIAPLFNDFTRTYLEQAVRQGKRVTLTGIGDGEILPYLDRIDNLILNRCEANALCAAAGCEGEQALSRRYARLTIYVTCGSEGSVLCRSGRRTAIPPVHADRLVDFTGAGDAYTSGVLSALAWGADAEDAAYWGAANASFVLQNFGGLTGMPAWADLEARLKKQFPQRKAAEEGGSLS